MIRYHYFPTAEAAQAFVDAHRADGGLGYCLGRLGDEYEARTIH